MPVPAPYRTPAKAVVSSWRQSDTTEALARRADLLDRDVPPVVIVSRVADLGFGRIVVSEKKVPNMLVNMV
jgi:hypothetical protein